MELNMKITNSFNYSKLEMELYSKYNKQDIMIAIAKLMGAYESREYICRFLYDNDNNEKCVVEDKYGNPYSKKFILPNIPFQNGKIIIKYNLDDICLLPPRMYSDNDIIEISYVQDFIDFLYEQRLKNKQIDVDKNIINDYLAIFLNKTKLARFINNSNAQYNRIKSEKEIKRKEYENSCLVSRKAIFKCIKDILNRYEGSEISADSKLIETESTNNEKNTITYTLYDVLVITRIIKKIEYEVEVCQDTVDADERELKNIDYSMDTQIKFFELKETIQTIFWDCLLLKDFMHKLEKKLYNNHELDEQDVYDSYLETVNKEKKYTL